MAFPVYNTEKEIKSYIRSVFFGTPLVTLKTLFFLIFRYIFTISVMFRLAKKPHRKSKTVSLSERPIITPFG